MDSMSFLSVDDLELTLKELRSQRVQTGISLLILDDGILSLERRLKVFKNG